jgi:predicted Ser/Thr protein kinase
MTAEITEPTPPAPVRAAAYRDPPGRLVDRSATAPVGPAKPTEPIPEGSGALHGELLGPYRLLQRLGQGGMGVVHFAVDPHGRAVAVKVLRPHIADDPDARARLEREVAALGRVRHPRVAPVIDADLHGPRPYVVTRYVAGDPLDDAIAAHGPLTGDALLRLARGLHGALEAIHGVGVVHRDLKPGNVLLDEDGDPVVIDFGIAHVLDDSRLTSTGLVMGTPGYLSPEIVEGAQVTEATDWWGWAATLVYAATGRPPFGRGSMDLVLSRVRSGEFDLAGVDARLEPLLAAALSPRPADRPAAPLVLAALERYAAGASATVPHHRSGTAIMPVSPTAGGAGMPGPAGAAAPAPVPPRPVQPVLAQPRPVQSAPAPPALAQPRPAHSRPVQPRPAAPSAGRHPGAAPLSPAPLAAQHPAVLAMGPAAAGPAAYGLPGAPPIVAPQWPTEGDPRIGRPDRGGPLGGLAVLLVAAAAVAPGAAVVGALVWSWLARTADRSVTSLVVRRHRYGRRRGDLAVTIAKGPLHVLGSVFAATLGALLPAVVGAAGFSCVAFAMSALGATRSALTVPLGLAVAMILAVAMAWWGPGGASLRRGAKSLARGVAPQGLVGDVVTGLLWAVGLALGVWLLVRGGQPAWWPLPGAPGVLDSLR